MDNFYTRFKTCLFSLLTMAMVVFAFMASGKTAAAIHYNGVKKSSYKNTPALIIPTISFSSTLASKPYGSADFIPATSNSAAPIIFTSDNPAVATIINNMVHIVGVGNANITATQEANDQYEATQKTAVLHVVRGTPSISFIPGLSARPFTTNDFVPATATLNAPIVFISDNFAVASIVNNRVNMVGVGTAHITAIIADNENYVGTSAMVTLTVVKSSPVINFIANFSPREYNTANFNGATATYGAPITYTSDNPAVATIQNNQINMVGIGTANITATVPNSDRYNGTSLTMALTVVQASPSISFYSNFSPRVYNVTPFTPATATLGAPLVYSSDNPAVAVIVNNQVRMVGVGIANITATVPESALFATTSVTRQLTVTQADQVITFNPIPDKSYIDAPFNLNATSTSGLTVRYTSSDETVAKIQGSTVIIIGVGTVTITASQLGNANFTPAPEVSQTFNISVANQTIYFASLNAKKYGDAPFVLTGTVNSGLPIIYTSSNPAVATIINNVITIVGAGSTTITASQPGNANYTPAADVSQLLTVNKADQVITFNPIPDKTYGDAPFALSATASSNLPVIYTSSNPAVATISGNVLTITGGGVVTITASQPGNDNFNAAADIIQTLTVGKAAQVITFNPLLNKTYTDAPFALTASASSNLPVIYTSSDPAIATISGNMVTITGVGTVTITASQPGNASYLPAADVTQILNVGKGDQTITFAALPGKAINDAPFALNATASSNLPVTYTSSDPSVATVNGNIVTIVGLGTVTITASQAGSQNYNAAADVTQSLTIGKANQTITFAAIDDKKVGDAPFVLSASASSGLAVSFSSSDNSIASVSGNTVTILKAGTVTITASQAGDATHNAAPSVTQTLLITPSDDPTKQNQTITFAAIGDKKVGDAPFVLSASASSGLAVSFSSSDNSIASVSGNTVTILKAGTVTFTASQSGNATYNPASASQVVLIAPATLPDPDPTKQSQTITFTAIGDKKVGDAPFQLVASASSGLSVSYSSSDNSIASVVGNMVTILKAGTVTLTASQAGNATYNPASASQVVLIAPATLPDPDPTKLNQTITFTAIGDKKVGDAPFQLVASASSGLPVRFTSSDNSIASVVGNMVTILKAGTVTLTASQAGNATYNPASASQVVLIAPATLPDPDPTKQSQTITFTAIGDKKVGDAPFQLVASASSGLPVSFTSSDNSIASVSGNTVTILKAGTVTFTASQSGNATYNPASASQVVFIAPATLPDPDPTKLNQTITFAAIGYKKVGDAPFQLVASASSGLAVSFSSSDNSIASVVGNMVTILKAGTVTFTASQSGNATYNPASASQVVFIAPATLPDPDPTKLNQTITFAAIGYKKVGDAPFQLVASASSGLAVSFSSSDNSIASVSGNTVTILKAGTVTITASQAGDATHNAAPSVTQTLVITPSDDPTKLNQTINFAAIGDKKVGDAPFVLSASASSGLPVSFSSSDNSIASVSGNTITILKVGTVTFTASQSGNATYNPASVSQVVLIGPAKTHQSILFNALADKTYGDAPFSVSATASSNLPVIFTSSDAEIASISGNMVTLSGTGEVTITATQAGDATYSAASASQTFTVTKAMLVVKADDKAKAYGTGNPAFTVSYTGFVNGESEAMLNTKPSASVSATVNAASAAGTYTITPAGGAATNYELVYNNGTLTVNKAPLTVTANNVSRLYGEPNPAFTVTYSGFVNGDTQASLTTQPLVSTVATTTSPVGTYAIVPAAAASANYSLTYVNGMLTVLPATATINFAQLPAKTYGDTDFAPNATNSVNEPMVYTSSNSAVATIVNGNIHITGAGTAIISAGFAAGSNYSQTPPATQIFIVDKAHQTINFNTIPAIIRGENYTLPVVTASSGLPVSLSVADASIIGLQDLTLTAKQLGTTTVTAYQPGNNNYYPATSVTQTVVVRSVNTDVEIQVHKAVSPNGDGINEIFLIEGITRFPGNMVTIVNRNGVKVYETTNYDNTTRLFNGRSNVNGQLQPPGTYFYLIQYMSNGKGHRLTGYFVLKY